mgnify:CR=1 FL=1
MNRGIFHNWEASLPKTAESTSRVKTMNLNFGPQHPAAHGVLRMLLQLNGEIVERADPHVGLLHRGSEKLMEDRYYLKSLPYFDRFDYVSMMAQEHAYCLAIESMLGTSNINSAVTQVRTLYDELTRILNHMLALACHALDVGSMSSIFWAFEEREKIMEFYERVSGARMHAAFYRPNDVNYDAINNILLEDILKFSKDCIITINEMHNVLTYNKIWKQRLVNIGTFSYKTCLEYGLTGVLARSTGLKRDLRLSRLESYANYSSINFRSYIGQHGDCYDRFLIRMYEMVESLNIVNQMVKKCATWGAAKDEKLLDGYDILSYINEQEVTKKIYNHNVTMENTINDFKYWSENITVESNILNKTIESPKGEFGVTIVSDSTNKPYKVKVRSPAYHHMQLCPKISKGHFLADLVAIIGTVDIVFGEIDR